MYREGFKCQVLLQLMVMLGVHMNFTKKQYIYVGIGRTTPWVDENIPPIPTGDETAVVEIFGYKNLHKNVCSP